MKGWILISLLAITACAPAPAPAPAAAQPAEPVDWSQYAPVDQPPANDGIDKANETLKRREDARQFAKDLGKEQAEAEAEIREQRRGR